MQVNYTQREDKMITLNKIKNRYRYVVLHGRIKTLERRCKLLEEYTKHIIKNYQINNYEKSNTIKKS